jgi:glycosyltransferase involved in cell wall biosynthesis
MQSQIKVGTKEFKENDELRKKYGFQKDDIVLFTLTRLSSKERYKGYDKVISAMSQLKSRNKNVKYIIAGSYDWEEKEYIDRLSKKKGLFNDIVITGFIPDQDLVAHFSMNDIYIMPSMKEGFGIVFIEAMLYGLPVIAGNKDGSVDALLNGELGILVDPLNVKEISNAMELIINDKSKYIPNEEKLLTYFSYQTYKNNLFKLINVIN